MTKELWKGNEAIAEAAVRAGMDAYFGYPITPQTELLEYLSRRMLDLKRAFVQAESELAAINMVYGAACAGARVMTSSSSPGISLMQEGISYIAGSEVPCVIVDIMRGGPGLGNLGASQADYFQLVKGGGHGDYHSIVLAPSSVQEAAALTYTAFDLADRYRTVVVIAADGNIGQSMEPVEMPPMRTIEKKDRGWELTGAKERAHRVILSIGLQPEVLEAMKNQKYPIEYVIPKEKGFGASEYVCVVKGTKNQELAEEFLNQMIATKAQRAFAVETHQGPISTKVELSAAEQARCACGAPSSSSSDAPSTHSLTSTVAALSPVCAAGTAMNGWPR